MGKQQEYVRNNEDAFQLYHLLPVIHRVCCPLRWSQNSASHTAHTRPSPHTYRTPSIRSVVLCITADRVFQVSRTRFRLRRACGQSRKLICCAATAPICSDPYPASELGRSLRSCAACAAQKRKHCWWARLDWLSHCSPDPSFGRSLMEGFFNT